MTRTLGWLVVLALVAGLVMGFLVAPRDAAQGNVQRIMYVHVPSVLVAYLAFAVVLLASIVYLTTRRESADRIGHASAEVGVLFTGITIASGAIWGKPTWGTWWTWDARLTSVAVLFVMYLGYLLVRGMVDDRERAARYSAVVGIVAALDQPPTMLKPGPSTMPGVFAATLLVNLAALALVYVFLVTKRVALLRREEEALA